MALFKKFSLGTALVFDKLYSESKVRFAPLSDPLDASLHLHRQLSASREEVYSDWFQWVLEELNDLELVAQVLGLDNPNQFSTSGEPVVCRREVAVAHGHANQTGRLDVLLSQNGAAVAIIEIKTRDYGHFDLIKHDGYRRSFPGSTPIGIFLAVEPPERDIEGFQFLAWSAVCVTLRRIVLQRLASSQILASALILSFVGAVEQNLLGFRAPGSTFSSVARLPRMVAHFSSALDNI